MEMKDIIKGIKKKLITRENGPASEAMENLGIKYKKNHGLSVRQIKDIAAEYINNHELALELYKEDIRELKIMSYVIEDSQTVSIEQIDEWVNALTNTEQAEQIAINLIVFNPKFYSKVFEWAENSNEYVRRTAFVLIARIAMYQKKDLDNDEYKKYIELCINKSKDNSIHVAKAISWALRRIGRLNTELYNIVLESVEEIAYYKTDYTQLISEEVSYELNDGMIKSMIK